MYSRQTADSRRSRNLSIPVNYSGNAFRADIEAEPPPKEVTTEEDIVDAGAVSDASEAATSPVSIGHECRDGGGLFRIFGGGSGGIGLEELLILGLAFLISQNDTRDDLSFLLLLLLFIK